MSVPEAHGGRAAHTRCRSPCAQLFGPCFDSEVHRTQLGLACDLRAQPR